MDFSSSSSNSRNAKRTLRGKSRGQSSQGSQLPLAKRANSNQNQNSEPPVRLTKILHKLATTGSQRKLESIVLKLHPADVAEAMLQLPVAINKTIVAVLFEHRRAGVTLAEMPWSVQAEILAEMDIDMVSEIIRRLPPDDAVDVLQSMDDDRMHEVMGYLNIAEVTEIEQLLLYDEDSAGGIMTPDAFCLELNITIAEARSTLRSEKSLDGMQYIYVVDEWNHLVGTIDFKTLLFAPEEAPLADHVWDNVVTVLPKTSTEIVAREMSKYDLLELPVVDSNNHLLGVITIDDVIDVIQESATEDIYAMAGLDEEDRVFSSPFRSMRLRLPWLSINLLVAAVTASVIGVFEGLLAELTFLAMIFPVIASTGGNAAIQTITVITRGFTLGEISFQNARRAILRETAFALGNGLMIGALAAVGAWMWRGDMRLSLVIFASIALNFLNAAIAGTVLPVAIKRLHFDPAVASGIFVTAMTDVGGYFMFLAMAATFL